MRDPLTGLCTGRETRGGIHAAAAASPTSPLAVCHVDIDRFKTINDTLGHAVGDEVLRIAAARLADLVSEDDLLGREVGDEFLILLSNPERVANAEAIAESARAAVAMPYHVHGHQVRVTASIGVSVSDAQPSASKLLENAGVALFQAKDQGRDQVTTFTSEMAAAALRTSTRCQMVRDALANDDIVVHYQPIVDLDGSIVAIEALARCRDANGQILLPVDFLDAILGTRLVRDLDDTVLTKALDFAVVLRDTFSVRAPWVACNVSATSLAVPDRASVILNELKSRGLQPNQLGLEITESAAFEADVDTVLGLSQLRDAGVHIALDDFGTGYSSLSHLVTLPLSILKIDKSFIEQIDRGGAEHAIAQAVTSLGGSLGLTVVAEGVETAAQERSVRAIGVDQLQGWTTGAAVDPGELMDILSDLPQARPALA